MMNEMGVRRPGDPTSSPKSSPRGNRSPVVPRQDSTGTLKTTISLGKTPSIVHHGPFYLMKEPPGTGSLIGSCLMCHVHESFVSLSRGRINGHHKSDCAS